VLFFSLSKILPMQASSSTPLRRLHVRKLVDGVLRHPSSKPVDGVLGLSSSKPASMKKLVLPFVLTNKPISRKPSLVLSVASSRTPIIATHLTSKTMLAKVRPRTRGAQRPLQTPGLCDRMCSPGTIKLTRATSSSLRIAQVVRAKTGRKKTTAQKSTIVKSDC
jgi:hypothetical protein